MKASFTVVVLGSYAPSLTNFRGPLIRAMVARGWRVIAAAPSIDDATVQRLQELGSEPRETGLARTGMNPIADLGYLRELKTLFEDLRPDAVIAYTAKPVIWGTLAARAARIPRVVAMITGLGFAFTEGAGTPLKRGVARTAASLLYRRALAGANVVLFQNPDDRNLFSRRKLTRPDSDVRVIAGSGIDLDHYRPAPIPAQPSFLMVARLLGAKGVREYAEAVRILRPRWPQAAFRLAGYIDHGPDAISPEELESWTASGLEFIGHLDDVRPALAAAQVYVLPSWREGTPRSVLEAMSVGRAIITTDAPGCRETVVEGRNGFLVPVRRPAALAASMERFLSDPALASRMGAASLEIARERYDVDIVNAQIIEAVAPS
jgi:glycosyltransferase involved in cell wall biosynthesis